MPFKKQPRDAIVPIIKAEWLKGTTVKDILKIADIGRGLFYAIKDELGLPDRCVSAFDSTKPDQKHCRKCDKWLPLTAFGFVANRSRNVRCHCLNCEKSTLYEHRKNNREFWLYHSTKSGARARGLDHSITPKDIKIPSHCPVLGIPLFFTPRGRTDNSPSIDRIDNNRSYHPDNILVVSFRANMLRGDATAEELRKLVAFYASPTESDEVRS